MLNSAFEESARLSDLLRREHTALAEFLVALSEFDRRRLWVELGYTSLFWYLHRDLGLSKGAAFLRKTAAELIQRFPEVLEPLRDGRLCLSNVPELAKVITEENRTEVLPRFFTLSKGEAKEVVAAMLPADAPSLRDSITAVHEAASSAALPPPHSSANVPEFDSAPTLFAEPPRTSGFPENLPHANSRVPDEVRAAVPTVPARPTFEVEPLTAELRRLHVTVSRRLLQKLDAARDALSHSHPGATRDEILEVGLDLILERHAKRRGLMKNPRQKAADPTPTPTPTATARSRHIPAAVKRAVWERDGGCCQFKLASGAICGTTSQVEYDHYPVPFALGGPSTVENTRLCCRPHQDAHARQVYGDDVMDGYTRPKGGGCSEPVAAYGAPAASAPRAAPRVRRAAPSARCPAATARHTARHPPNSTPGPARARRVPPTSGARVCPAPKARE
jgi:hypothetical protein